MPVKQIVEVDEPALECSGPHKRQNGEVDKLAKLRSSTHSELYEIRLECQKDASKMIQICEEESMPSSASSVKGETCRRFS